MEWIRKWLDRKKVKALKQKVARMRTEAEEAEVEPLMPAVETISRRIRRERLVVLERAIEKIDLQQSSGAQAPIRISDVGEDEQLRPCPAERRLPR